MNIKQWFSFSGLITRKEYWITLSIVFITTILLEILGIFGFIYITHVDNQSPHYMLLLYSFVATAIFFIILLMMITWIETALLVKRCRDIGINPFWTILLFIPYVNLIAIIVLGVRKSKQI